MEAPMELHSEAQSPDSVAKTKTKKASRAKTATRAQAKTAV